MKASMFNILTEQDDGSILFYNSMWGTLATMDKKSYDIYKAIIDTGYKEDEADPEIHTLAVQLKKGGFIVEDSIDELKCLKQRYENNKSSFSIFRLYIVPTSACNFACKYCYYEGCGNNKMPEEVQDALLEFVKKRIGSRKVLNIVWTGGEPTLAPDVIIRLSKGLMKITKELGIAYVSSIFTNGYLFDRDMAEELYEYGVRIAQIVVDGPRQVHNQRRPLINGSGTFDVIMKNLKDISAKMDVALRVNLDSTNANSHNITSLLDSLRQCNLPGTTIIELAHVMPFTSHCFEFIKKYGLSSKEFGDRLSKLYPLVYESGFRPKIDISPEISISPCMTDSCFGISEEGDLYRCFLLIGDKNECVGNLLKDNSSLENDKKYIIWNTWSPFSQEECRKCNILPICMGGGCPLYDVVQNDDLHKDVRCIPLKFYINEAIKLNCRMLQRWRKDENAI
ncbi:MAG: radical SAM protein [Firmicutes bacterium]|nr:radical SAM protein [Bacillota bacterium]